MPPGITQEYAVTIQRLLYQRPAQTHSPHIPFPKLPDGQLQLLRHPLNFAPVRPDIPRLRTRTTPPATLTFEMQPRNIPERSLHRIRHFLILSCTRTANIFRRALTTSEFTEEMTESGRWDSNPRHSAWEADILPLNYARANATPERLTDDLHYYTTPAGNFQLLPRLLHILFPLAAVP